ncbi:hypothetical protein PFLmoz3_05245 [Pseudomonas fluorescens]|uniref:Uncharacterized protein n=1 Tax=Pseudomonas fluorescens TaxID=294 RepID=A0A109LC59_PSEFL|nr:hypothetical protein PFLmoz3_05245 [Pseudomonas fluorescens]
MAVGRIVVAEYRQRPQDFHAWGIDRHQDHRVLLVTRRIGVAQAHEDQDLAARVAGAGGPPLLAVDHPLVALAFGAGGHVGGVRGRHIRFGHGKGGTNLAAQQGFEPALFLFFVGVAHQHFHVAGVGSGAVEWLRAEQRAAHDFRQGCVFKVGQASAQFGFRQKQVPQALGLRLGLEFFHDRRGLPAITFADLAFEHRFGRVDISVHERSDAFTQFLNLGRIGEIHEQLPSLRGCLGHAFDARTALIIYLAYSRRVLTFITDI